MPAVRWTDPEGERWERVELLRRTWHDAYPGIVTPAEIEGVFSGALQMSGSWEERRRRPAGTLVADAGRLVGLASIGLLDSGDGELAAFYVLPGWQGRGVGTLLWEAARAELRRLDCPRMEVWTFAEARARSFYEHRGCIPLGTGTVTIGGREIPAAGYITDL